MATDISPELLKSIRNDFNDLVVASAKARAFTKKVADGTATQADVQIYSSEIGRILGKAFGLNIREGVLPNDTLYWNIAESVVRPLIENNYRVVTENAVAVQKLIDRAAGVGLNAIAPEMDPDRIKGILESACEPNITVKQIQARLNEPVRNLTEHYFDDFVMVNAAFRSKAGMKATITRKLGGRACEWCRSLAGTYSYEDAPDDVYRRHENCRCQTTFVSEKKRQNVWTKALL